ncbi:unnamed protein product [Arabidopsis halleri]
MAIHESLNAWEVSSPALSRRIVFSGKSGKWARNLMI